MQRVRSARVHESIKRLHEGVIITIVIVFITEKKEKRTATHRTPPHTLAVWMYMCIPLITKKEKIGGGRGSTNQYIGWREEKKDNRTL